MMLSKSALELCLELGMCVILLGCGGSDDGSRAAQSGGAAGTASAGGAGKGGSAGSLAAGAGGSSSGGKASSGGASSGGSGGSVVAPAGNWANATGNLPMLAGADAGEVTIISAQPGTGRIIAGISKKGLFATDDGGTTWIKLGTGAGSAPIDHGPLAIVYDPLDPTIFWENGIYGSTGGVFKTIDNGVTFQRLGDISHNDLVTVDFSDPDRKLLLAGGHEAKQKVFRSTDSGQSWTDIGSALPADSSFSSDPLIIDTQTFLVGGCGFGGGTCGVVRSTDAGATWTRTTTDGATGRPLWASNGSIYWTIIYDGGVTVSTDQGVTWSKAGGPVQNMSGSQTELPDGRIVTLGKTHLLQSADGGKTWTDIGEALPFPGQNCNTYGFTYSAELKTFFINHNNCSGNLIADAVYSSGFDYTTN
ncbi:MAG TPA: hypothetical protein VGP93_06070 [Polyangiaceae bacterium]|nr:hypothetical protein [Polyangiaceae bacterium]